MSRIAPQLLLALAILVGAAALAAGFMSLRSQAEQVAPETVATRVEVVQVDAEDLTARVQATGVVQPAQQVALTPQVSGRIVWQSKKLEPGSRVEKGTVLARIDPTEFELLAEQARSSVRTAEVELELEKGRQRSAAREWALLGDGRDPEDAPLALRKPQLEASKQGLAAAQSSLKQAELNLQRTYLIAPFNAVVLDESIDVGQVVGPTTVAATLVGTDEVWVKVSVPVDQLPAVVLPRDDEESDEPTGSPARIEQRLGGRSSIVRNGSVARLMGQLDPQTRTAQLLVAVPNPMEAAEGELPLLPGAYVDVAIDGKLMRDVFRVPRNALENGERVWVVDSENALRSRTVTIGWREADDVIVTSGLEDGSRLVVSPLALPIEGMPVDPVKRVAGEEK